jgi:hypothetical protein
MRTFSALFFSVLCANVLAFCEGVTSLWSEVGGYVTASAKVVILRLCCAHCKIHFSTLLHVASTFEGIQSCDFTRCFVWVCNLISHHKGRTYIKENIWDRRKRR